MSDLDLFADLVTRKLVTSDGGAVALPALVLGDMLRCSLRTMERNEAGDLRERDLRVRTLRASVGRVLEPPTGGWFKLWIGDHDTPEINFNADADTFKTAAQGSGIIDTVEKPTAATWIVRTTRADTEPDYPIYVHTNRLAPTAFVRVRQFKQLGVWWFECRLPANFNVKELAEGKTEKLPRAPGLLPAIHDATVVPIAVPLPRPEPSAGNVFQNTTNVPLLVPGGLGRRGGYLDPLGYAGSDGRAWYRLSRAAQTNSFYPLDFERELFLLHINDAMWKPGGNFAVEFDLELQLIAANTRAQMLAVIEVGSAPGQTTPAPVAENLENIVWQSAPVLAQRLIVSGLKLKHHFGAAIKHSLDGVLTAERLLYTTWQAASVAPTSPSFVVRARLIQFDTENSVRGAKGFVFAAMTEAKAEVG